MKYVALKLRGKSLDDKVNMATNLAASLDKNVADYPDPDPTPQEYTDKVAQILAHRIVLSAAQTQFEKATNDLAALEDELDGMLTQGGAYIQKASKGVESKIVALGVGVRNTPLTVTSMDRVLNFRVTPGNYAGEVRTACDPVPGARSYQYQINDNPTMTANWKMCDTSSTTRATLTELPSGKAIWIRARAVGGRRAGKGPWSDPKMVVVP